jgi:Rieske Fe-S protein
VSTEELDNGSVAPDGRPLEEQPAWRQAYPIDWPAADYVSRREFTRLLLVTSGAFVAGQAWLLVSGLLKNAGAEPPPRREISTTEQIQVGKSLLFYYPNDNSPCLLVHLKVDHFVAFSQKCTHLSCPVLPEVDRGRFHCPCHEGEFDIQTGVPLSGPPRRRLPQVALEIVNGRIYATGIEEGVA